MIEHPTDAGFAPLDFQPGCEIVRRPVAFHGEKTKSILTWLIKGDGAAVEGDDAKQGPGNSVEEGLLGQVCDDGIVDFKQRAVTLCDCEAPSRSIENSASWPPIGVVSPGCRQ
jgi:hypothetical protein